MFTYWIGVLFEQNQASFKCHDSSINDLKIVNSDFDDVNGLFATAGGDGVKIWDIRNNNPVATIQNEKNSPFFSMDSRHNLFACGTELKDYDAEVHIYDRRDWSKPLRSFMDSHHDDVTDLKFHPSDSNLLISGSTDGYVNIYDLTQEEEEDALHQVINFASIHSCGWLAPNRIWTLSHMETFGIHELNDKSDETSEPRPVEFGDIREKWGCDYVIDIYPGYVATGRTHEGIGELKIIPFQNEQLDVARSIIIPDAHGSEVVRDVFIPKNQNNLLYSCGEDGNVNVWKETTNSLNVPCEFWDYTQKFNAFANSVMEVDMDVDESHENVPSSESSNNEESSDSGGKNHNEKKKHKKDKKDKKNSKHKSKKKKKDKEHRYKPY